VEISPSFRKISRHIRQDGDSDGAGGEPFVSDWRRMDGSLLPQELSTVTQCAAAEGTVIARHTQIPNSMK
jgi:hypothetical protein